MIKVSDTKSDFVYTGYYSGCLEWWDGEDVDIGYEKLGYDKRNRIVKMYLYTKKKSIGWFE